MDEKQHSKPPSPLEVLPSEELITTDGLRVVVGSEIPSEYNERLWDIVTKGFVDLNSRSYEKQDMTRDEFDADMESKHVLKYIALDHEERPVGYLTVHEGLSDVTWADTSEMSRLQEELDPEGVSFYIGTIVVPASLRSTQIASSLLRASYIHLQRFDDIHGHKSAIFFDCAEANFPGIPEFARRAAEPSGFFQGVPLDVRELQTRVFVRDKTSGNVKELPEQDVYKESSSEILDRKHYFMVTLSDK